MRVLSVLSVISLAATLSAALPIHSSTDTSGKHGSITLLTEAGKEAPTVAKLSSHGVAPDTEEEPALDGKDLSSHPHLLRRNQHDTAIQHHTTERANLQAAHQTLHDNYRAADNARQRAAKTVEREKTAGTLQQHHIDAHTNASAESRLRYNLLKENEHSTNYHTHMINGHTSEKAAESKFNQAEHADYPQSLSLFQKGHELQESANHSYNSAAHSQTLATHSRNLINNP
ncbi:hypothetical protein FRC14_003782 [Serendipita sp. 396]|nr:hypothetical protein FRC14_003782 [Serendipita sp. 396]KAG8783517.1 hypothetical protein FRC15_005028 [Serendipita sp. 397]KAG8798859.1 hypothetical protein FRC16_006405 [Serendipita sp. 398]KAG8867546.1 hypothetical protein FRC20_005487 [Serendipita sp. 405]